MKIELTFKYDCMPHIFYRPCQIKILPEIPIYRKLKKIAYRYLIQETVQHIYKNYDFVIAKILKKDRYIKQKSLTIDK